MDQNNSHNKTQKQGRRISTDELIKYIKTNKEVLKTVKCIDLNDVPINVQPTSLEKTQFQNLVEVDYLPTNLSQIFKLNSGQKYLHAGCLRTINVKTKTLMVSFYSSILSCLIQQFFSAPLGEQINFTLKLLDRLKKDSCGTTYTELAYKRRYGWKPNDIENEINMNLVTQNVMKFVSDYFHINIFILNLEKDLLHFGGDEYIPYKRTIFLIKYPDGIFEPLFVGNTRAFTVDNEIIKEIRNDMDCVNVFNFTDKHVLGFEETEEELVLYLPKQDQIKLKVERPEEAYDKQKVAELNKKNEKIKNTSKKSTNTKNDFDSDQESNEVSDDNDEESIDSKQSSENKFVKDDFEYDEDMNAYDEREDSTDKKNTKKKIKQLSDDELEVKPKKVTKTKSKTDEKKTQQTYKESDINSSLKMDKLKEIAKELGLKTTGTKNVLIETIKNKLKNEK